MNIFEQNSYKVILKHYFMIKAKSVKGVSKKLAEHLNVNPSLISLVMTGNKDFTEEQMFEICEFLGISKFESEYLMSLLKIERAGSFKLKTYYTNQRDILKKQSDELAHRIQRDQKLSDADQSLFYSSWIYSAIHMYTTLEKDVYFDELRMKFNLDHEKMGEILNFLIRTGLVIENNGIYKVGKADTHLGRKSPHLNKHHSNWRLKAIDAFDKLSDQELTYTVNFSVSEKDLIELRKMMLQSIEEFLKRVKASPAEKLAQFNLDLFWVIK